ncbi:MAG: WYL domain-containing transcriptional regulator [Planctomycetes bacterium]|nr:WYL domain-containing transcriptional regulator [Planctomycetota bacterium]
MKAPERIHRLLKLVTVLQTGKGFTADELAAAVPASRRTLFRDLSLLKQVGIPVKYDGARRVYQIEQSFFLPPVNLTLSEVLGLMTLVHKQGTAAPLPNHDAIATAMMKIESILPREIQDYCGSVVEAVAYRSTPTADVSRLGRTFDCIWQAAYHREKTAITYESFHEGRDISVTLRPYRLTFIARAWYVIGFSEAHGEVRTFKLDRVLAARPTGEPFDPDPDFDLARYFGNAWQMIRGDREYGVRVRFSPRVAGNVEEVLWHPTQQVQRLADGSLRFEARVDGLLEIVWWVLGYGKEAEVEAPAELRDLVAEHVVAMGHTYGT